MQTFLVTSLGASILLGGCMPAQDYAGINYGQARFSSEGKIEQITMVGGKEGSHVEFELDYGDVRVRYKADDLRAFEGQALRAQVEAVVAEQIGESWRETVPGIVDALISAVKPGGV